MKSKILGAVSALALMVAVTSFNDAGAASATATTETNAGVSARAADTKADLKQGWENTKDAVSRTTQNLSEKTKETYADIKARVIDDNASNTDVTINERITAKGMLGQPVHNTANEKIGTLKDIILDKDGNARQVVVSDGGFMGIGDKLAAFDYNLVMRQESNGDVIMPLSEDQVKQVSAFSYNATDASDTVDVIPAGGYSVAELLKGKLLNPQGKAMGNIENITFRNGEATQVIVAFDQKLGMGGQRVALGFDDLTPARAADGTQDFRMNTRQSAQFEAFKNTRAN